MVILRTVSSFFSTCGCFLRDGRSPSGDLPSLSLACGWPPGANDSLSLSLSNDGASRALGLNILRVQGKGGRTDVRSGPGRPAWADRPRPIPARHGHPFAPMGPQVIMHFAPSTCMILTMSSSRPRWRLFVHEVRSFTLQSPGVFLRSTSVLATIGSDFIKIMNTNNTPHPSVLRKDDEGAYKQVGELAPIASSGPRLGGSTHGYISWACTERRCSEHGLICHLFGV
jgi:hypothetical protein